MDKLQEFENLVKPVQDFLKENYHPHVTATINPDSATLSEILLHAPEGKRQNGTDILSGLYQKLTVLNIETDEEIAVITHGETPVNTAGDNIVVKLTPFYD